MTGRYTTSKGNKDEKSTFIRNIIKPVVFILGICTTVLLFTLPIIFYYLSAYTDLGNALSEGYLNNSLTINLTSANGSLPCDSSILSWGVIEDSAECEPYSGTICLPYLTQWNQCILLGGGNQEEKIHVAANSNGKTQDTLEQELSQLNALLVNFPKCQPVAIPFLCHYYFPLMAADCRSNTVDDNQPLYTVTQEDCITIRDTICAVPWQLADTLGYGNRLPDCQSLPNTNASVEQINSTSSLIPVNNQSVSCRDDFILINSTCYPRCDRFEEQSQDSTNAMIAAEILAATAGSLLSGVAFILALYNRKRMFRFPSLFLLLFVCHVFIIAILVLINAINRTKLNCSSINLIEALNNPTPFCYITGALFHDSIFHMAIWWFFHLSIFFYEMILFPFHAHRTRELGRLKKVFIVLLIAGFLIPVPGVIAGLTSEKDHYHIVRFPPSLCVPSGELWFYSAAFPITVLLCIGTCLLIMMLWKINKQKTKAKGYQAKKNFTVAEKKLIFISVLFIIYGSYLMIHFGIVSGNGNRVAEGFTKYFLCESTGHVPKKCNRKDVERYVFPELNVLTFLLMGTMLPLSVLNFIVNWGTLWKSMTRSIRRITSTTDSDKSHSSSNTTSA